MHFISRISLGQTWQLVDRACGHESPWILGADGNWGPIDIGSRWKLGAHGYCKQIEIESPWALGADEHWEPIDIGS
eukprot:959242-Pelagomonas_calceolata.AAC.3